MRFFVSSASACLSVSSCAIPATSYAWFVSTK